MTGRVWLTVPTAAVSLVLTRLLPRFVGRHPKVAVEVRVDDCFVDPVAEGLDAGIRLIEAIDRAMLHSPEIPGLFLYFPSRAQVPPALKAFVDLARATK